MDKQKYKDALLGGIANNPVFILVVGMCPVIAQSRTLENAFILGVATTFVLVCSTFILSLLRKLIPDNVRIPVYIVVVATFVTTVIMFMQSYMYEAYQTLGAFLSLITVNCLIMARIETFASKNPPLPTLLDSLSMGAGFVFGISLLGGLRELLVKAGFGIFNNVAGGFMALGFLMVLYLSITQLITKKIKDKKQSNAQSLTEQGTL